MAGRPRASARKLAERMRLEELNGDWMIRPPPPLTDPPKEPTAKDLTADWWRQQVRDLARAASERTDGVENGNDAVLASQARVFGALGVPTDVAAALMGMSEGRFQAEYADAYGVGSAAIMAQVSANFLRIATSGSDRYAVKACIEIMNRRGGEPWRPPAQKIEVTRPQPKQNLIDSRNLSPKDRAILRGILERAVNGGDAPALEHDGD
jgi:hypothetical protein